MLILIFMNKRPYRECAYRQENENQNYALPEICDVNSFNWNFLKVN